MPLPLYKESVKNKIFSIHSVIAVAAGKGGVGKSTVTVNLARTLLARGFRVGILDADIYGPSLRRMLPEDRLPSQRGEKITPALSQGIQYISMAYFRKENEAAVIRAPIANGVINQFLNGIEWGELDYLLIDFPPGTGDIQLTLAQKAYLSGAVLVTTPQEVSVMDVRKAAAMFDQVKVPVLGLVENMSYFETGGEKQFPFGKGGGERLARELGVPLLGQVAIDSAISRSGDTGKPLEEGSKSLCSFSAIAEKLVEQLQFVKNGTGDARAMRSYSYPNGEFLEVVWSNGVDRWSATSLQAKCPCAGCVDEWTGLRRPSAKAPGQDAKINSVKQIGRYAIQLEFREGCSAGIFDFDYLATIPKMSEG
jgi:ATP-binding protein involved in chromosome partitioning